MKHVQILCPVFREEDGILEFHRKLLASVRNLESRYTLTFMYVVDPGGDQTEEILANLARQDQRVGVLVMSRRFGHQAALIAGIDACKADALVMLDSDGQHPPELIDVLVDRWERGAQIVQTLRKDGAETGLLKRATSAWFYRVLSRIGSIELKGGAADYRLLDRCVVKVLREEIRERNAFLRGLVAWVGFNIHFVEFQPLRREYGASKYRAGILFNFALQGVSSFSKTPLRVCTIVGLAMSAISMLVAAILVVSYLIGQVTVPGWATLVTFMALLGGMQLCFIGILGEYLGQIFDEVKQRPRYIVAARHGQTRATDVATQEVSGSLR